MTNKPVHSVHNFTEGLKEDPKGASLQYRTWTFTAIQRGDCLVEAGATFTLIEDGSTVWSCQISSGDHGDEWDGHFDITNGAGELVIRTGTYHFDISDKDTKHQWDDSRGPNSDFASHFAEASTNNFYCSC